MFAKFLKTVTLALGLAAIATGAVAQDKAKLGVVVKIGGIPWFNAMEVGIKQRGEELNDPFENRRNDTPMTALCRTIEIDLRQALGEQDLPPPLQPVNGVLM